MFNSFRLTRFKEQPEGTRASRTDRGNSPGARALSFPSGKVRKARSVDPKASSTRVIWVRHVNGKLFVKEGELGEVVEGTEYRDIIQFLEL